MERSFELYGEIVALRAPDRSSTGVSVIRLQQKK